MNQATSILYCIYLSKRFNYFYA